MPLELVTPLPPGAPSHTRLARHGERLVVLREILDGTDCSWPPASPRLITLQEVGELQGKRHALFEWVPGVTLRETLKALELLGRPAPIGLVGRVVIDAARALSAAEPPRPHGGLNDGALQLGFDGVVSVLDWGAPRQTRFRPLGRVNFAADVFALGAVIHSALTGYQGEYATLPPTIPPPSTSHSEATPAIDDVVMRALAPQPDDRQGTVGLLADELEAVLFDDLYTPAQLADVVRTLFKDRIKLLQSLGGLIEHDESLEAELPAAVMPSIPLGTQPGQGGPDGAREGTQPRATAADASEPHERTETRIPLPGERTPGAPNKALVPWDSQADLAPVSPPSDAGTLPGVFAPTSRDEPARPIFTGSRPALDAVPDPDTNPRGRPPEDATNPGAPMPTRPPEDSTTPGAPMPTRAEPNAPRASGPRPPGAPEARGSRSGHASGRPEDEAPAGPLAEGRAPTLEAPLAGGAPSRIATDAVPELNVTPPARASGPRPGEAAPPRGSTGESQALAARSATPRGSTGEAPALAARPSGPRPGDAAAPRGSTGEAQALGARHGGPRPGDTAVPRGATGESQALSARPSAPRPGDAAAPRGSTGESQALNPRGSGPRPRGSTGEAPSLGPRASGPRAAEPGAARGTAGAGPRLPSTEVLAPTALNDVPEDTAPRAKARPNLPGAGRDDIITAETGSTTGPMDVLDDDTNPRARPAPRSTGARPALPDADRKPVAVLGDDYADLNEPTAVRKRLADERAAGSEPDLAELADLNEPTAVRRKLAAQQAAEPDPELEELAGLNEPTAVRKRPVAEPEPDVEPEALEDDAQVHEPTAVRKRQAAEPVASSGELAAIRTQETAQKLPAVQAPKQGGGGGVRAVMILLLLVVVGLAGAAAWKMTRLRPPAVVDAPTEDLDAGTEGDATDAGLASAVVAAPLDDAGPGAPDAGTADAGPALDAGLDAGTDAGTETVDAGAPSPDAGTNAIDKKAPVKKAPVKKKKKGKR